jgi:uncharacterized membrane protein
MLNFDIEDKERIHRFGIIIFSVGIVLMIIAVIRGITFTLALFGGFYVIRSVRDLSTNIVGVIFDFVIPFIGGFLLVIAGNTLFGLYRKVYKKSFDSERKYRLRKDRDMIINSVLSRQEMEIVNILKSRDGKSLQSDLIGLTGYSKVKVHRLLKNLENKGVVRRSRSGITNSVFLTYNR